MLDPLIASYGSWKSPITADCIASEALSLGHVALEGNDTYWIEKRPWEEGRSVIVWRAGDGKKMDLILPPYNARTRVHEYGGGDFVVGDGVLYFSNFTDQRLYRIAPGIQPIAITPARQVRYADAELDKQRHRLICICEDHSQSGHEAVNTVISVWLDGKKEPQTLISGNDFYSTPRLSPDGSHLAWLTWNHPNMPWDGCELWMSDLAADGRIVRARKVAGGASESIFQPQWSPDGLLYFVSDRTGWWNIYRQRCGKIETLCQKDVEFGLPQWVFGMSCYDFVSSEHIVCCYAEHGRRHFASLNTTSCELTAIETPYTFIGGIHAASKRIVFCGASPKEPLELVQLDLDTNHFEVLCQSRRRNIDSAYISMPQSLEFVTEHGLTAYAIFYLPYNPSYQAPKEELPPLLVLSHGGPTAATSEIFNAEIQFWTSRGIAVLDVNYGGSVGYGRAYRERLRGQWGIVDVDDCVNGAKYLVECGWVDPQRLLIRGSSAGGYTTLCALTFRDVFAAGASYFGVSNAEALVRETHKFESHYLFALIGPYPEQRDLYFQRSAINFTDRLSCPMIFFQGLDDNVVPPSQAKAMFEVLKNKGVPVAYLAYEDEGHGFRKAKNIRHSLENEFYFYTKIFNFAAAEVVEPVKIENL